MLSTLSRGAAAVALAAAAVLGTASVSSATVTEVSAPVRVHIGAPYQNFLVEVGATNSELGSVDLIDPVKGVISTDEFTEKDDNYWTALPDLYTKTIPSYGKKTWSIDGWDYDAWSPIAVTRNVEFRAHSMVGLAPISRSGSTLYLNGSVRVYNNVEQRYQGWTTQPVLIERKGSGGVWTNIGTAYVDWRGNFTKTITGQPAGVTLRLRVNGTTNVWDATSATQTG